MDTCTQLNSSEEIDFIDVDIQRLDETFYKVHIDFFIKHLGTDQLIFFTSEDVKYLENFEFLRTMEIEEEEKLDKFTDIDFNDVFYLSHDTVNFKSLDVCLILNGVVDVMILRKWDVKDFIFTVENSKLSISHIEEVA